MQKIRFSKYTIRSRLISLILAASKIVRQCATLLVIVLKLGRGAAAVRRWFVDLDAGFLPRQGRVPATKDRITTSLPFSIYLWHFPSNRCQPVFREPLLWACLIIEKNLETSVSAAEGSFLLAVVAEFLLVTRRLTTVKVSRTRTSQVSDGHLVLLTRYNWLLRRRFTCDYSWK